VTVNGQVVSTLGTKVDPESDVVQLKGVPVGRRIGTSMSCSTSLKGWCPAASTGREPVVTDLVDLPQRLFPVGRLDKDSTGLLLMTNDGRIHHRLSHPSFDHEKEYDVTVQRPLADQALAAMERGMPLSGVMTRPAGVRRISGVVSGLF
jgi:23S rRNA pseudouridine2605 synthase